MQISKIPPGIWTNRLHFKNSELEFWSFWSFRSKNFEIEDFEMEDFEIKDLKIENL